MFKVLDLLGPKTEEDLATVSKTDKKGAKTPKSDNKIKVDVKKTEKSGETS